ncbi:MAG: coproporphyrinogen III oxidase family protein [Bdellovibrionales bacterium]|nr:coproporphyrinogen III oxidase family protein [Bdellovibrionales bacterium]
MSSFYDDLVTARILEYAPVIRRLASLGISKQLRMRNTSQIVVTYPAEQDLTFMPGVDCVTGSPARLRALYLHLPFCTGICTYCSYARSAVSENDPFIDSYITLLEREVALVREKLGGGKVPVASVYLGGGTPTLLSSSHLRRVFELVGNNFTWHKGAEYTLEGSPETISAEKIHLAKLYGVNRVSIGVESFNEEVLSRIGRRHDVKGIFAALDMIRNGGISNIDIDLIRGLPGYSSKMISDDLSGVERAGVPSVTSYQYSLKPKSIDWKKVQTDQYMLDRQYIMHLEFIVGMEKLGFVHQAPLIDCFIRDHRAVYEHNIQKWRFMGDLIGVGLGSYGYINGTQYINFRDRKRYSRMLLDGLLPVHKASHLSEDEIMRRRIVLGLKSGVDRKEFALHHGCDPFKSPLCNELEVFRRTGALEADSTEIKLTPAGALFADWIQMAFYSTHYKSLESKRLVPRLSA